MQQAESKTNAGVHVSTTQLQADQRSEGWSRLLSALATVRPQDATDDKPLNATLTSYDLGTIMVARCSSSAVHYLRDEKNAQDDALSGHVMLQLLLSGNGVAQFDGVTVKLYRGDICLIDLARSTKLHFDSDCDHINVLIARELLPASHGHLHGRILRSNQSLCRMLSEHLMQLLDMLPTLTPPHFDTTSRATLAVLHICLSDHARSEQDNTGQGEALLARMLGYIEAQLGDSELGVDMLQRDFRVSRATVYRVFSEYGGVNHCIREKRLRGAFNDLSRRPHQQIGAVVFRWGFSCERQFQRAFMAQFGMTPSAARRQGALAMQGAPFASSPSA